MGIYINFRNTEQKNTISFSYYQLHVENKSYSGVYHSFS